MNVFYDYDIDINLLFYGTSDFYADNNILGLLEAVSQLNRTHSESFLKPEDSDEEVSDNVGIGTDEIDACVKPPHVANQEFSRAQIQDMATTTRIQEVMPFTTPTGRKKKGSLRSFHSTTPIHSLQQAMMAEVSCSDTDLESDAGGKDRFVVDCKHGGYSLYRKFIQL